MLIALQDAPMKSAIWLSVHKKRGCSVTENRSGTASFLISIYGVHVVVFAV